MGLAHGRASELTSLMPSAQTVADNILCEETPGLFDQEELYVEEAPRGQKGNVRFRMATSGQ
eukprot:987596-Alexandrium_andersonii.AAC.1